MAEIKIKTTDGNNAVTLAGPASGADVTLKLPTAAGSAGEFLKTDGSNGQLSFASDTKSFRNYIYNGEMAINQRGTTTTINGYGGPDRWKTSVAQAAFTASKDSESPPGFNSSLKLDCTTAATLTGNNSIKIIQHLEGQDLQSFAAGTSSAKSLTLSFWVRSTKTGVFNTHIYQKDGGKLVSQNTTISSANTWEKKTFTVAGNTADTIDNDNSKSLTIEFWLDSGPDMKGGTITDSWAASASNKYGQGVTLNIGDDVANDFYLTGVQLETGSTASDFEHRSYGDELARCQRYYQVDRSGSHNTMYESWTGPIGKIFQHNFITTMRDSPTTVYTNGTNGISNSGWGGATPTGHASVDHVLFHHGSTLFHLAGTSNGNIGITFSAEL